MSNMSPLYWLLRLLAIAFLLIGMAGTSLAKIYTDNGDGTVTDPTTGLTWMRCAVGQILDGSTCVGTASTYTWYQATTLPGTVTFAAKSDWRLPNWNATAQKWYFWAPALVNSGGLGSFINSKNYLDSATMPSTPTGTLSPTTGFWVNMP